MAVLIFLITRCPDCLYTKFSSVKNYMGPVSSWSLSLRGLSQENKLSRLKTKKTPKTSVLVLTYSGLFHLLYV